MWMVARLQFASSFCAQRSLQSLSPLGLAVSSAWRVDVIANSGGQVSYFGLAIANTVPAKLIATYNVGDWFSVRLSPIFR